MRPACGWGPVDGDSGDLYFYARLDWRGGGRATHQPVEQLAAFRAMPNMLVLAAGRRE